MMLQKPRKNIHNGALAGWLALLVLIPMVSVFGRSLQRYARDMVSSGWLAALMLLALTAMVVMMVAWFRRHGGAFNLWHLLWMVPLFLLFPLTLPLVEERLHFLLFGGFGFFSMLLFPPLLGLAVLLAGAGLDEVLQWALPDRVGDWRDVGFNALASVGGGAAAFFGGKK
ncbi:hypothetical protein [Thiolapillus sp.]